TAQIDTPSRSGLAVDTTFGMATLPRPPSPPGMDPRYFETAFPDDTWLMNRRFGDSASGAARHPAAEGRRMRDGVKVGIDVSVGEGFVADEPPHQLETTSRVGFPTPPKYPLMSRPKLLSNRPASVHFD